jgi:hypothetical protein
MQFKSIRSQIEDGIVVLILAILAWLASVAPNPPDPVAAGSAVDVFSAERAFSHVQAVAKTPHPVGSQANAEARNYILQTLRGIGVKFQEESFSTIARGRQISGVNVIARIPGAKQGRGVALVCHYDSVPSGPGAADDGAGVATLLETARALRAGAPLQNDVLFLFTDGEELGLLGAKAFVRDSQSFTNLALVLNFEARGVSGPVYMFETSPGNGRIIAEFAQVIARPVASSLMYEVYRRMPNDTDFTVFKKAGIAGLNFGFIGEPEHYHARTDDPAHLSLASLQHQGAYALSLARQFANSDLSSLRSSDAVYFDLFGRVMLHYPARWAIPFALLGTIAYMVIAVRTRASPVKVAAGFFAFVGNLAVVAFAVRVLPFKDWTLWYSAIFATIIIILMIHVILRHWLRVVDLSLGALFAWLLLAIASAVWLPGASYLTVWPTIFALSALLSKRRFLVLSTVSGAIGVVLLAPLVRSFYVALGPAGIFVPMLVLTLLFGLLTPQLAVLLESITPPFFSKAAEPKRPCN